MSDDPHNVAEFVGKRVKEALLNDNRFILIFEDGTRLIVTDDASYCCEHRYMSTDDNPSDLVGKTFVNLQVKDGPDMSDDGFCHDTCFVDIVVNDCTLQLVNHNEHNGYYGGFEVKVIKD